MLYRCVITSGHHVVCLLLHTCYVGATAMTFDLHVSQDILLQKWFIFFDLGSYLNSSRYVAFVN